MLLIHKAWNENQNLEWERTRLLAAFCRNAGVIARGMKVEKGDLINPIDLFPLPQDRPIDSKVTTLLSKEAATDKAKQFFEFAKKRGFNKE